MAKTKAQTVVAISAEAPDIVHYRLLGVSGAVTVTGIFVNDQGKQVGLAFSTSIAVGNGTNVPQQIVDGTSSGQTSIPSTAVGAIINTTGNLYFGLYPNTADIASGSTTFHSDMTTNYARYPIINSGNGLAIGAVAVV